MRTTTDIVNSQIIQCMARKLLALVAAVLIVITSWVPAESEMFDQYQVKAVFLYNLAKFIKWPASTPGAEPTNFVIGILGHDVFDFYLEQTIKDETIEGRRVRITHYNSLAEIEKQPSQLLFIAPDKLNFWPQIREIARRHRILTVSDVDGFCRRGGIVNLLTSARKIQIEINMHEAKGSGFDISSKLLKLARIVNGFKEE